MKRYLAAAALLLPFVMQAKALVEKPRSKQPTSFVIVVDRATYDKTNPQLHAYRDALEADGLSTYILCDDYQTPEQVRGQLVELMHKTAKRSPLEGAVFVGDIPIAMVRNAQHMTTAFKMDEKNFPMNQSSVPSDRYYDCPDLRFELIARDTTDRLLSYFNLACDSPQRLDPAFYSGRIRYPEQLGGDKYEGIARYLEKVVAERAKAGQLDCLVTYAGDGYNSDCLSCWMDERIAIDENFPLTHTRRAENLRQLNFRMDDYMKYRLFDELAREEVDAIFFNEHGSPDKQHVGSYDTEPDSFEGHYEQLKAEVSYALYRERRKGDKGDVEGAKQYFKEKYHLTDAFFEPEKSDEAAEAMGDQTIISLEDLASLAAQPRFVMLNACYNGSFHKPGYIAGYYIFGPGRTVAAQGNTVNVLQDRWTYEMVGLLSHGVRVGQYNRLIASLEGHIIGDPAFRFRPVEENTLSTDMTTRRGDAAYWRGLLAASPWADVQSLSLRMLADAGAVSAAELLAFMEQSPLATTRMECLKLLERSGDEAAFAQAIIRGLNDRYELLRRNAANYAGESGRSELLPALAAACVNDAQSKRVAYVAMNALELYPETEVELALQRAVEASSYADREAKFAELSEAAAYSQEMKVRQRSVLFDKDKPLKSRISAVRTMRNNTYHELVPELLKLLADASQPLELRVNTAECLGWFAHTPSRALIAHTCRCLAVDKSLAAELRGELTQTAIRLEQSGAPSAR